MVKKKRTVKKKGDLRLKHREFWIFIAVIFLLSVLTILNFIGDSSVTGHATVQTISYMEGGTQLHFEVHDVSGVKEATLQLVETVKGGKIFFEEDSSIPFDRNFYSKFKVSSTEEEKYRGIRFIMKIKESDLLDSGVSKGDLRLFVNGKELPTTFVEKEGDHFLYRSTAFEFGDFVIGKTIPVMVVEEVSEEELDQAQEGIESESLAGEAAEQIVPEKDSVFGNGLILILVFLIVAAIIITIFVGKRKKK